MDDNGHDERILLRPKSYAVLRYLVERVGRLVTEDELLDAVWPEACVEPQAVKSSVFDVRRVLGDSPKKPVFIETLPKRGYRFIAPVQTGRSTDGKQTLGHTLLARTLQKLSSRCSSRIASSSIRDREFQPAHTQNFGHPPK